ncbi:MAG: hypothetical protein GTO63_12495 [Anaerolineae bacterium]|nr:hypothetical protein [Anaerolineae bacterium]NIN95719.1 hypothetical protein [Anaerolineae bacterium]
MSVKRGGWHLPEGGLIQIWDINTDRHLPRGETGEIVVTLFNPDYALVRFGMGDLSTPNLKPCPCGRSSARLIGWQGRVGDAVRVRGMFLHPRQLHDLMRRSDEISCWQTWMTRQRYIDHLAMQVLLSPGTT